MSDYEFYLMEYRAGRMPKWKSVMYFLFDKLTSFLIPKGPFVEIKDPKKILVIRNDHIGDFVLSTPVFREIKKAYPKAEITVLASSATKQLIEKNKNIDKIITFGIFSEMLGAHKFSFLSRYLEIFKKIKNEKYDLGIDLRSSSTNMIFLLWLPGVKTRIGYYNVTGGRAFLTKPILLKKFEYVTKVYLDLAKEGLNFKTENYMPEIITDKGDEAAVRRYLKSKNLKNFICIAPAATAIWKAWPAEKFEKLIRRLSRDYQDYKILLVGGKADSDLTKKLSITKNCISLNDFNLRQVSLILKKSRLIISNDGGIRYIAWASGTKSIAIFGTKAQLNFVLPWKDAVVVFDKSYDIANVKVSRVEKEVRKILG